MSYHKQNLMTQKEARALVEEILTAAKHDPEAAHSWEDDLYEKVLKAVANGSPNARALARIALETKKADFPRWCA